MNTIYSEEYKKWHARCQKIFIEKYRRPDFDSTIKLINDYYVISQSFGGEIGRYTIYANKSTLYNREGKEIFTWHNLNSDGDFATLFLHSNGKHYLVFRIDLYGYGVLELESGKELYYMPSEAYPDNDEDIEETFIWTGANYDPNSDLLAVDGCYWACPASTIIVDFTNPLVMQPHNRWFDVRDIIDPERNYSHIEPIGWQNGMLILQIEDQEDNVCLSAKELKDKMCTH